MAINNARASGSPGTPEEAQKDLQVALAEYKQAVEGLGNLHTSDRKKLLALPFYMSKRTELPEPRKGQDEYNLFKEITGNNWDAFNHEIVDT